MYWTTPSITRPMFIVLVSRIGTSSAPCVSIQMLPVISPVPFITQVAAGTLSRHRSPPCGRIAVTPVRTGPFPGTSFPAPRLSVTCPTRTPFTSVMASSGPGASRPMTIPSSRTRRRGPSASARGAAGAPITASVAAPAGPPTKPATDPPRKTHIEMMIRATAFIPAPSRYPRGMPTSSIVEGGSLVPIAGPSQGRSPPVDDRQHLHTAGRKGDYNHPASSDDEEGIVPSTLRTARRLRVRPAGRHSTFIGGLVILMGLAAPFRPQAGTTLDPKTATDGLKEALGVG